MSVYNVMTYGAVGNGTTNDTAAINAAIAACAGGTNAGIVYFPAGTYRINSTLNIASKTGCILRGEGTGATYIKNFSRTQNAVTFGSCQYCGIENLTIVNDRGSGNPTAGYAIEFNGNSYDCHAQSVNISYCYNGVRNLSSTNTTLAQMLIRGIYGLYGVNYSGTAAVPCYGMIVEDLVTDPLPATGNTTMIGINNDSYGYSLSVRRAALLSGGYGFFMADTINDGSSRPLFAELIDLECDHNQLSGAVFNAGDMAYLTGCWIGSALTGNGIFVASTFGGEFGVTTSRIVGNAQHGILMNAGSNGTVISTSTIGVNSQAQPGSYHGVTTGQNFSNFVINGCKIGSVANFTGGQGYGVFINAGSTRFVVSSNVLSGNLTGGVANAGVAPNAVVNNIV